MVLKLNLTKLHVNNITPDEFYWMYMTATKEFIPSTYEVSVDLDKLITIGFATDKGDLTTKAINFLGLEDPFLDELSSEYRDLFPSGVKTSGIPVKSSLQAIRDKFSQFIEKYPTYKNKELIIDATKDYLETMARDGYKYCTCANYFILKSGEPKLLTCMDEYKDREVDNTNFEKSL